MVSESVGKEKVLINGVDVRLKELLTEYAANLSVDILEMEITAQTMFICFWK